MRTGDGNSNKVELQMRLARLKTRRRVVEQTIVALEDLAREYRSQRGAVASGRKRSVKTLLFAR